MSKILLRHCIIRFAIVCPYARCRAYQLVDQTLCNGVHRYLLCKIDDNFSECRRSFFKVIRFIAVIHGYCSFEFRHSFVIGYFVIRHFIDYTFSTSFKSGTRYSTVEFMLAKFT